MLATTSAAAVSSTATSSIANNSTSRFSAAKRGLSPERFSQKTFSTAERNPLLLALRVLPVSPAESRKIVQRMDTAPVSLSQTSALLAREIAAMPNKKSMSLADALGAFQMWAESQLNADDLVLLHNAAQPTSLGMLANVGITIVCNSRARQTRIAHAAELLLAAILGYFRFPIALRLATENEVSARMFAHGTVLLYGQERRLAALRIACHADPA